MSDLASIRTFPQLVKYLRDELDWPITSDDFEDLTFDYTPQELGIDSKSAAKIQEIKRLRSLSINQPWGVFFVKFEPKRLPIVALRRILSSVALKRRASANSAERKVWEAEDLLFISNYGEGDGRQITFAHFSQDPLKQDLPTLKVLGWDNLDTPLHLDHVTDSLHDHLHWPQDEVDLQSWRTEWRQAFGLRYAEVVTTSRTLAIRLAELARAIRNRISTALEIETEDGPLTTLMRAFREALVHDIDADGFADMYAQTIAYGLLSARIANPKADTVDDLAAQMPVTNPFLKELMETFLQAGGRRKEVGGAVTLDFDELGVSDVVELLDRANMEAVIRDFGDRNPQEDPVIHFYELFLKEYDAKKRMQRGVFYTPRPVVSYIVRSVHELLQSEFGLADGLADTATWADMAKRHEGLTMPEGVNPADRFVTVLDPATGTGTFLVEVISVIRQTLSDKWALEGYSEREALELWNEYVPRELLPRIYGYELLMAPYAIAHLKVGLKLYETGYRFASNQRARIYLTNTLEPPNDFSGQFEFTIPALAREAEAVNAVKRGQTFTVVIGNPPYAGLSANLTPHARTIVERYRFVSGTRIYERGALQFEKNLQDDYVKFFSWSEVVSTASGYGLLGFISNDGFLDTPTLRGMRWSLQTSFSELRFLALHGSVKRPIAGDRNVFDIQQGVAISLLAKTPARSAMGTIGRADLVGTRESKYAFLSDHGIATTQWQLITPLPPLFQFSDLDSDLHGEYSQYMALPDIMPIYSSGTETGFDRLLVDFSRSELMAKLARFLDPDRSDSEVAIDFAIGQGTARKLLDIRAEFRSDFEMNGPSYCIEGMYRVFDRRVYYYKKEYLKTNSLNVMRNLMEERNRNLALVAFRQQSQDGFQHAFVTRELGDKNAVSLRTREINYYFPLTILPELEGLGLHDYPTPNFRTSFLSRLAGCLGVPQAGDGFPQGITGEDVFFEAYAKLHSARYRVRYESFLRTDFPRLPLTSSLELFRELARLGGELVALHLMESSKLDTLMTTYTGPKDPKVGRVGWLEDTVWLDAAATKNGHPTIPSTIGFRGVPEEVWNFYIGGYQVCEKWLKDRKGRVLTADDITHYQRIVVALHETIRIMGEIDEVIDAHGGWPDAFFVENVVPMQRQAL